VYDREKAEQAAKSLLTRWAGSQWHGAIDVPWLEDDHLAIGTPVAGIKRDAISDPEILFGGSTDRQTLLPHVVSKTYVIEPGQDGGTPQISTEIVLHDHELRKHLGPLK
jgi:hypothetical protein